MNIDNESERRSLTFSQREGKTVLPDAMKLGDVPRRFRVVLWREIYTRIKQEAVAGDHYRKNSLMRAYISAYQEYVMEVYYDDIKRRPSEQSELMKSLIADGEYHQVLTLIEFILRGSLGRKDKSLHRAFLQIFEESPMAYFVDDPQESPTICPRQDKISGEVVAGAMNVIREGGLVGAKTHLTKAANFINEGRYEDSIVQSAHAIESVARAIAPDDCKTLKPALNSLERHEILNHRALKDAFLKLYGYTSDKQGLRHAILEDKGKPPDLDEAVFFYGACACFAAYLTKKSRQITEE